MGVAASNVTPIDAARGKARARAPRLLSKRAVAEHYDVSTRTVERWMQRGLTVARYVGNRPRFTLSDVEAFLG